jgi:hypothetical protein
MYRRDAYLLDYWTKYRQKNGTHNPKQPSWCRTYILDNGGDQDIWALCHGFSTTTHQLDPGASPSHPMASWEKWRSCCTAVRFIWTQWIFSIVNLVVPLPNSERFHHIQGNWNQWPNTLASPLSGAYIHLVQQRTPHGQAKEVVITVESSIHLHDRDPHNSCQTCRRHHHGATEWPPCARLPTRIRRR